MILKGVLFLAAFSARSAAYAQALCRAEIEPALTVLYGPEKGGLPGQVTGVVHEAVPGVPFVHDPGVPVQDTLKQRSWQTQCIASAELDSAEMMSAIGAFRPKLVIFSGYGGQIVNPALLDMASFLHVHPGWLPDYRGSTTIYYSMLDGAGCAASAILLGPEIDKGPVIARKRYPLPAPGINVDYVYDPAIRADLLIDVMRHYADTGTLPPAQDQGSQGHTYYIIHPVLKHIALLSLERPL